MGIEIASRHPLIVTESLTKAFGKKTVVDHIDLSVSPGEVFGFLGPNGAGKTTTIRMLTTVIPPTSGNAWVNGHSVREDPLSVRRSFAVIPQRHVIELHLDVYQNIRLYLMFHGYSAKEAARRTDEAIERFGLESLRHHRADQLSGGQVRRVQVARALFVEKPILFLDEPTTGLDPLVRRETWERIRKIRDSGRTIFLTTQSMEEAEALCTSVAIIFNGKIVIQMPVEDLKRLLGVTRVEIGVRDLPGEEVPSVLGDCRSLPGVIDASMNGSTLAALVEGNQPPVAAMIAAVSLRGGGITTVNIERPTLEQVYLRIIKGEWKEGR